jgi:membrane-bound metal-dependent hydrolase YbcI (DUF457 family)
VVHRNLEGMDMKGATHVPLATSTYLVVSKLASLAPPTHSALWRHRGYQIPGAPISTRTVEDVVSTTLPLIAAAVGALLPDFERPGGSIRDELPWLAYLTDRLLGQRGLFHSLSFNFLIATLALLLGWANGQMTLAIAFTVGLASHLVADLCTLELPLLKPFSGRRFSLLPPEKRVVEGYMGEWVIMVASSVLTIGLLLVPYLPLGGIR